jgi:N-glycosylase/DNA lyase
MSEPARSDWRPLRGWTPTPEVLRETLDGGQSFRWFSIPEPTPRRSPGEGGPGQLNSTWIGAWSDQVAQLRLRQDRLEFRGAGSNALNHYLASDTDWAALTDSLPWRSDPHLAQCIAAFPSLRILRQPFGETLLGFLCSATKQIVQIKQMCALLAGRHGSPICRAGSPTPPRQRGGISDPALQVHRLPTWSQLATIPEKELRACLLGFRARYIAGTARFLAAHPGWLDATERLPYPEAKAWLLELPGVGEKVADCVLLFGAGKLEAFPVDTWVLKSLARRYGLEGWRPAQVAQFGRAHFGPLAGLAQQYLFAWERKYGGR